MATPNASNGPGPAAVRAQPRPGCAAERQNGGARRERAALVPGPAQRQRVVADKALEGAALEAHALRRQPRQQRPQQGRGLEAFGKHPPAGADESFFAKLRAKFAQPIRRKGADDRLQPLGRRAIAREENLQRLAVRQIEAAAPGHQKFARGARLVVKDGDASARARQNIGGDEAGWAGADHGAERGGSGNLGIPR